MSPSSKLYREALSRFHSQTKASTKSQKDLELLDNFLAERARPEDAKTAAGMLRDDASKKWGSDKKLGKVKIPAGWIDNIMGNIANFVQVGNYAMTGAPESVGLAWFAVKLTLSAIQGNYELYSFFGSGLTDITEIMVIIPHYDQLYDERAKPGWKASAVVDKLFGDIINAYVGVLNFSFAIKRHISAGSLAKAGHIISDFMGTSKSKFQGFLDHIATQKKKVLEDSTAAFQDKSLIQTQGIRDAVDGLKSIVNEVRDFQPKLKEFHVEQMAQLDAINQNLEAFRAATKAKTPWDFAMQKFNKIQDSLKPLKITEDAFETALAHRFANTCQWVFDHYSFVQWHQARSNMMLCITGANGTGKSTLLGTIAERLGSTPEDDKPILLFFSCEQDTAAKGTLNARVICNTLLHQLHLLAKEDEDDVKLLEDCNDALTPNTKGKRSKVKNVESAAVNRKTIQRDDDVPDMAEALPKLAALLKNSVMIVLDGVEALGPEDQIELFESIKDALMPAETIANSSDTYIKALIGCRVGQPFQSKGFSLKSRYHEIDVGEHNRVDMKKRLSAALDSIQGLSTEDRELAEKEIIDKAGKAGSSFSYITEIAIPFMRQPFQGAMPKRLEALPRVTSNTFQESIAKMPSNYLDLLRVAVTWTLLLPDDTMVTVEGSWMHFGERIWTKLRTTTIRVKNQRRSRWRRNWPRTSWMMSKAHF